MNPVLDTESTLCFNGGMETTATLNPQPVTLFYQNGKGWFVSYPTASGFMHERVASKASDRPSDVELAAKGYVVR